MFILTCTLRMKDVVPQCSLIMEEDWWSVLELRLLDGSIPSLSFCGEKLRQSCRFCLSRGFSVSVDGWPESKLKSHITVAPA
jgi:hypothetical protein